MAFGSRRQSEVVLNPPESSFEVVLCYVRLFFVSLSRIVSPTLLFVRGGNLVPQEHRVLGRGV